MKINTKIFALSTNNKSSIQRCANSEWWDYGKDSLIDDRYKWYCLYSTNAETATKEEIDNNVCIFISSNNMIICLAGKGIGRIRTIGNYYKILSTDDKDLHYKGPFNEALQRKTYADIPPISPEFQQAWVREANKGTPILEALMEFTDLGKDACKFDDNHLDSKIENLEHNCLIFGGKCSCLKKIPKLNPQGYVTILPLKEKMYPIDALRESFKGARRLLPSNDEESDFNKWLKMYETVNL